MDADGRTDGRTPERYVDPAWNTITVEPFSLAALKVCEFTCKFILALFILANPNYTFPTLE